MFPQSLQNYHWKKILDEDLIPTAILDSQGNIVYANKAGENVLGIKKEFITDRVFNSPDWKKSDLDGNPFPIEQEPFVRVMREQRPVQNIRQFIEWPNKKKTLLNINAYPLFDDGGKLSHVVAQMEDITERYALIKERDEEHRNYHFLFRNMTNGYAYHRMLYNAQGDPIDYIFLDINDQFTKLTGLKREIVIGRKVSEIIPNFFEQSTNWVDIYGKVAKSGISQTFEQYDELLDHNWLINAYSPQPDHFVTLFLDISERKKMEEKLRRSESKYRVLFESDPSGVAITEKDGTFIDFNQIFLNILGYSPSELHKMKSVDTYANPLDRINLLKKLDESGNLRNVELMLRRKSGESFEAMLNINFVEINKIQYLMTTFRDVSDLRRIEREKRRIDQKVQTTQKLESLGILAGGIAHDFNNLLVGILGNAELIKMDVDPHTEIAENLNEIINSAKKAADLSQQMLLYAGKRQIQKQSVSLNDEISNFQSILNRIISKNAEFIIRLEENLPKIAGDPIQIQQVLMNLITNASDALEGRNGTIHLTTQKKWCEKEYLAHSLFKSNILPGEYILLQVRDTGAGINPENLLKIFDPFFTTKAKGRGLGLSTVLGIVQNHKGAIIVDSTPGESTTFNLLFPISDDKRWNSLKTQPQMKSGTKFDFSFLLIDDEPVVLNVGQKYLTHLGIQVKAVHSGEQALAILKKSPHSFDAVILDLIMPYMDGYTVFQHIREINATLPVFISSGYSEYDITEKFTDGSIAGFLQKPFTMEDMASVITKWQKKAPSS